MSVAESIVILPPMSQVGCASASSALDVAQRVGGRARGTGPPEAVSTSRSTVPGRLAAQQLEERRVLGVDRDHARAGRLGELHHELAADDEALLVGERQVDALAERRDRRARGRPSRPGRSAPDRRPTRRSAASSPSGPASTSPPSRPRRPARRRRASASATRLTPNSLRLREQRAPSCVCGRKPDDLEVVAARDDVERLRADRPGRAEDEEPSHGIEFANSRAWAACRAQEQRVRDVVADDHREEGARRGGRARRRARRSSAPGVLDARGRA